MVINAALKNIIGQKNEHNWESTKRYTVVHTLILSKALCDLGAGCGFWLTDLVECLCIQSQLNQGGLEDDLR